MWSQGLGESFSLFCYFLVLWPGLPFAGGRCSFAEAPNSLGRFWAASITSPLASQLWNKDRNAKARHRAAQEWWVMSGNMEGTQRWGNARSSEQFCNNHSFPILSLCGLCCRDGGPQAPTQAAESQPRDPCLAGGRRRLGACSVWRHYGWSNDTRGMQMRIMC